MPRLIVFFALAAGCALAQAPARMAMTLSEVLALAMRHGREPRLAEQELAARREEQNFVRADYHAAGTVQWDTDDERTATIGKKLSQGGRVRFDHERPLNARNERHVLAVDQALFVHNALDVRIANLRYAEAKEAFRVQIEDYKLDVVRSFLELVRAQERY
jgi:hypothetical protein